MSSTLKKKKEGKNIPSGEEVYIVMHLEDLSTGQSKKIIFGSMEKKVRIYFLVYYLSLQTPYNFIRV